MKPYGKEGLILIASKAQMHNNETVVVVNLSLQLCFVQLELLYTHQATGLFWERHAVKLRLYQHKVQQDVTKTKNGEWGMNVLNVFKKDVFKKDVNILKKG